MMTEIRRLDLHMEKCIEDLDKRHFVPNLQGKKPNLLVSSAQKLYEKAEEELEKGDEEAAYVYFMKYMRVVTFLSQDEDYRKDKKFFNSKLGPNKPEKAITMAGTLKTSLISRYKAKQKSKKIEDIEQQEAIKKKMDEERKKAVASSKIFSPKENISFSSNLPGPDDATISCDKLFAIIKENQLKIMILDTRPAPDYEESHIIHANSINVPEKFITAGKSANVLEQDLSEKSRSLWGSRGSMDLIVLVDWTSKAVIPSQPLHILKVILLRWDVKVRYKREPVALEGGYEEWLFKYPSYTTNPNALPPNNNPIIEDILGGIDYPSVLEFSPISKVAPQHRADIPVISEPIFPPSSTPKNPIIDRSSKAAALQTYQERAKGMEKLLEKQEKLANDSLSIEQERIEAEEDWKNIRAQRENEAKAELRASFQLREQEITSQLMQLESRQHDMEIENQDLREKLEEYRQREKEEAGRLAEVIARTNKPQAGGRDVSPGEPMDISVSTGEIEESPDSDSEALSLSINTEQQKDMEARERKIRAKEEMKADLGRTREALESERIKRLKEAREKKPGYMRLEEGDRDTYTVPLRDSTNSSGGLNRSQSSPNIAQMVDDEETMGRFPTPHFDRTTKPHGAVSVSSDQTRQRDFEPVWGNVPRGLTGLKNLGNTCYMNSIVQCLNQTSALTSYFCSGSYRAHVNRATGTRGAVAEELAAVVRALWSGEYKFIATKDLRNVVGKHQSMFRGVEQQDSHEFLTILMDWLHDDLQVAVNAPQRDSLKPSEKAWHEYTKSKESLILKLFYGQIKSTVKCTVCCKESVTYELFSNLSLELPANANRCTLSDCLKLYLNDETIPGWNCPGCKEKRDAVKKLDISTLPPVLVIHFKRFFVDPKDYVSNTYRKKQTYIDFPLEDLDMSRFSLRNDKRHIYNLYGVSNHYGSMEGGHYTAYCKSNRYGKWYKFDDHVVTEISPSDVKSSAAYILFYTSQTDI